MYGMGTGCVFMPERYSGWRDSVDALTSMSKDCCRMLDMYFGVDSFCVMYKLELNGMLMP